MSAIHKQLALAETTPGMVLSDDLLDRQGHVLLPAGATLTEQTITSLQRHGVETLRVVVGELSAEEEAERRLHFSARIEHLFRRLDDSKSGRMLHQCIRDYRLGGQP